jgi:putative SOS response-associated peptidase YedK
MCGRYIANTEEEIMEIREILKQISMRLASDAEIPNALSEIFPTHEVMFINKAFEMTRAKWGLEKWDKKGIIINARCETYESNYFKKFAGNRCVIPAHGYYEWQKTADKSKIKYAFTSNNKHGIFMAGIYNKNSEFAVITKPAEGNIEFIHPRMPLIIKAEQVENWLTGKAGVRELSEQEIGVLFREAG